MTAGTDGLTVSDPDVAGPTRPEADRSARPAAAPGPDRTARLAARLRRGADGPAGVVVLFVWAVAEAAWFPLIPDSGLAGMTWASPRRAVRLWTATVLGTAVGSALVVWATRRGLAWPLALVTERMAAAAAGWVATDGAAGLVHQPLSGVPVKAFNTTGAPDVSMVQWVTWVTLVRGVRMACTGAAGALAGAARDCWVPVAHRARVHVVVVGLATPLLLAGLAAIVWAWS